MSGELKPCPFCGDNMRIEPQADWMLVVKCISPRCIVRPGVQGSSVPDVIAIWNRRASPSLDGLRALVERWRAGPAGGYVADKRQQMADELDEEIKRLTKETP